LPLVHFRFGGRVPARTRFVKAWIAAGDGAIGLLFAFGGIAIAPVSFGGVAVGLLPVGGAALGVLVTGGFGLGVWTFGGLAIGWQAFGGCALAWNAAEGGAAIARDFAVGGFAHAVQANNEVAMQFVRSNPFFRLQEAVAPFLMWLNLLWFLPMILWWRAVARRQGRN
jgi:hypothetical protein